MKDITYCAGALIVARKTGRILLLLRNEVSEAPLTWSIVAGHLKKGEDILEGLKREIQEETAFDANNIDFYFIEKEGEKFYYFNGFVDDEFECELDVENLNYGWFSKDNLPTPLFPNLKYKIDTLK